MVSPRGPGAPGGQSGRHKPSWPGREWLRTHTFAPAWLPEPWQHPLVGYAGAALAAAVSTGLTYVLVAAVPGFAFPGAISLVAILAVAVSWGGGPALFAAVLASLLLNIYAISPKGTLSFDGAGSVAGFLVSLAAGVAIGLVASEAETRRRQLAAILETIADPVIVYGTGGNVILANPAARELLGAASPTGGPLPVPASGTWLQAPYTLRGEPLPPEQWPKARVLRGETLRGSTAMEVALRSPGGKERYMVVTGGPIQGAAGALAGAVEVVHEVTAQVSARRAAEATTHRLRAVQAISDTALAHLAIRDLIDELLMRLAGILGVDNTGILIPSEDGQELRLYREYGPKEEVAGQVHVPVGQGIAGTIAATRRPLAVDDLHTVEGADPFLKEQIRSLMAVPLVVRDRLVGVLHAGTMVARHFSEEDVQFLQLLGDRIGLALAHARLFEEEQRLHAETAERAAELEAVFEAIADGVFVFGPRGEVLRGNSAARDLLDMDQPQAFYARPQDERGRRTEVLDTQGSPFPADEWPLFRVIRGEVLKGEQAVDLRVRTPRGERELSVSGAPIRDRHGAITGAVCVLRDVTERRRLEAQLLSDRDRLQQILDVLPEGIMVADLDPPVVAAMNRAALEFLGVNAVGQPVPIPPPGPEGEFGARRVDGTPYPIEDLPMERALLRGEVVRGDQFLIRNAVNGREVTILASSAPLRDAGGAVYGAVEVFQDITALRELERQREEFLTTVSHDLKNPLTSILGISQLLQLRARRIEEPERTRFAESLHAMERTARQMAVQIDELLDITRVRMGRPLVMEFAPADVVALLARVVDEYQKTTDRHILSFQHGDEALVCMIDAPRLQRAMANLLGNAIKYTPDGGEVRTTLMSTAEQDGAWLTISVTDQGVGIPSDEVGRVFDGFYRASNVATQFTGTGIGLKGVRQVVEEHGGTVTLQSTEGAGTTVTIRLPLRRPPAGESA